MAWDEDPRVEEGIERGGDIYGAPAPRRPPIVCLCGSTRFGAAFRDWNLRLTLAGNIVLSIGCDTRTDHELWREESERIRIKSRLDELHKRKIDLADTVFVLDVEGYIGESTRSEIEYAVGRGKRVAYLSKTHLDYEPPPDPVAQLTRRLDVADELLRQARPHVEYHDGRGASLGGLLTEIDVFLRDPDSLAPFSLRHALGLADAVLRRVQTGEPYPQPPGAPTVNNRNFWIALRHARIITRRCLGEPVPAHCPHCLFELGAVKSQCMACGAALPFEEEQPDA